jgi:hypothetical protein
VPKIYYDDSSTPRRDQGRDPKHQVVVIAGEPMGKTTQYRKSV